MDFQDFLKTCASQSCILSVQKLPDGEIGEIRIIAANDKYIDEMGRDKYYDGMLYSELVPGDRKFEKIVFESAYEKKPLHAYVDTRALGFWTEQYLLPLEGGDDNLKYCHFIFEFTKNVDASRMSRVSPENADAVIENCITFRTSDSFYDAVDKVIYGLRNKCDAEACVLLNCDDIARAITLLSASVYPEPEIPITQMVKSIPYDVVDSWRETVGESNCILVENEHDMEILNSRNPIWAKSLKEQKIRTICFVPLYQRKKILGYLYVTNFDTTRVNTIKELIEITSFFLSAELTNYNLLARLDMSR